MLTLDAVSGILTCQDDLSERDPFIPNHLPQTGFGRGLTTLFRDQASDAEQGAGLAVLTGATRRRTYDDP